jgi:hypothetical protein
MNLALRTLLVTLAVFLTFGIAALVLNVAYDIELQDLVIRHHLAGSSLEAPVDLSGDEKYATRALLMATAPGLQKQVRSIERGVR